MSLLPEYARFLDGKAPRVIASGVEPGPINPKLKDFQAEVAAFCIRQGRAGNFLDTGLGKTNVQLEFGSQAVRETNRPALLLTPLAVARQIEAEAAKFGYDAGVIRDQSEVKKRINICNYDRLDKLDPEAFGAVMLDESSILKSFTGKTSQGLISAFEHTRFRLASTATPAPNDHMELGQHSEFLGAMASNEMLARWFISDQTEMGRYRLKGHAVNDFWDWMSSWARMAQTPNDLGFDGTAYVLPPLRTISHKVSAEITPDEGLFGFNVSATQVHALKRQTAEVRAGMSADLVRSEPNEPWVLWVDTDYEADAVKACLAGAVEVRGSDKTEAKEERLAAFASGEAKYLITKPSICGYGLNWQHCARTAFVGRSFSYEAWYQAIRRFWRFGQSREVQAHLIVAEGEDQIGRVIDRKASDHARMKRAMAEAMRRSTAKISIVKVPYQPNHEGKKPSWLNA